MAAATTAAETVSLQPSNRLQAGLLLRSPLCQALSSRIFRAGRFFIWLKTNMLAGSRPNEAKCSLGLSKFSPKRLVQGLTVAQGAAPCEGI